MILGGFTEKMPKGIYPRVPRQRHPNSLANLKSGSEGKGKIRKQVTILPETYAIAKLLGANGNNASDGIDRLFRQLPAFRKCRVILMMIAANPEEASELVEAIESLLLDMEDMEIEQVYEEAVVEGVIEPRSGSWIV